MFSAKTIAGRSTAIACTCALLLFVLSCSGESAKPQAGYPAPDFTLTSLDGVKYTLNDLKGKVVFVNLWATWCPPCRDELPSMVNLYNMFKGKDLEILAVSEDSDVGAVNDFIRKYKITFPVLMDDQKKVYQMYKATGIPETHLIDKSGKIVSSAIGPFDWTGPSVVNTVRNLLAK
jgi:peroxiredoxin